MRIPRTLLLVLTAPSIFFAAPAALASGAANRRDPLPPRVMTGVRTGHPSHTPSGRVAAAHSYELRVQRGLVPGRRAYGVSAVAITTQDQQDPVWCVPASTRAVLSAFLRNLPTQAQLAAQEGTNYLGTYLERVPAVLNQYQHRVAYEFRNTATLTQYREQVRTDVDVYRAPLILAVDPSRLPWYQKLSLANGNHAIVGFGYVFTPRFAGIDTWDPSGLPEAGEHVVGVDALWHAGAELGEPVVW